MGPRARLARSRAAAAPLSAEGVRACLPRCLGWSCLPGLTSFHVNPVHLAILLEKVQDGSLWGIILKVAAEDLQAQLSTAREKPLEYEDERDTVRNVYTLSAARCGD